eukprot:UN04314
MFFLIKACFPEPIGGYLLAVSKVLCMFSFYLGCFSMKSFCSKFQIFHLFI